MSDKFQPLSTEQLARWVAGELDHQGSIFGLPKELYFQPDSGRRLQLEVYDQLLETPFGVAAGPHSQMSQNIIVAWLCGARFMELKTVQTLDELEVSKPCIDMQDAGYNVEWSQELLVRQSFHEYLRAWVVVHALHRKLGFSGDAPGAIFNMSVGYDLEGIKNDNVQWFLRRMNDAGELLTECVNEVAKYLPEVRDVEIPARLSDNVTLSTMHGCPPGEIGQISRYLMEEWGLHTSVKLNPTLLGPERVRYIVNEALGFDEIEIPDIAFEHDLKYPDAVSLLQELQEVAASCKVTFGIKLCNTLEVVNHRDIFADDQQMMYMSGRPHHALAVNLAHKLWQQFDGALLVSFAGGVDAFNVAELLAGGMTTITTCSDLLKPGGYTRLLQYLECSLAALDESGAESIDELIRKRAEPHLAASADSRGERELAGANLGRYAEAVLEDPRYKRDTYQRSRTKTSRALELFDCIEAPCADECPVTQQVPLYMEAIREGDFAAAAAVARQDNPMSAILGRACTHLCEEVCARTHYDEPLAIRELKRFIMDKEASGWTAPQDSTADRTARTAVVGGGPCGLSVAYFLSLAGYGVTIFEAQQYSGGMVSGSIPAYRATQEVVEQDLSVVEALGVEIRLGVEVGRDITLQEIREQGFDYVVLAAGAQKGLALGIPGEDGEGVLDGLEFLRASREGNRPAVGPVVGVIGGGDVAMDCARTAARLSDGQVSIIYRRTMAQMPAHREEIEEVQEEGIAIHELLAPESLVLVEGKVTALKCARMRLGDPDASGRRSPVATGEKLDFPLDTLIVAIGQQVDPAFLGETKLERTRRGWLDPDADSLRTEIDGVYAGGDLIAPGPTTIVKALGDGKRIAADIRNREEGNAVESGVNPSEADVTAMLRQRSRLEPRVPVPRREADTTTFEEILATYTEDDAQSEAGRCLRCDLMCSVCTSVCPNRAFFTYRTPQGTLEVSQSLQTAVLTDFCNECGNCATFCPTAGRPYQDKPRLYLSRSEFEGEKDNAFFVTRTGNQWAIEARSAGETAKLTLGDLLSFESPGVTLSLDPESCRVVEGDPGQGDLELCFGMLALLRGVESSMSHLPF